MKILITGSSGFIGFHTSIKLLNKGFKVFGYDSMNNYYDVSLKKSRLKILKKYKNFSFQKGNIENEKLLNKSVLKFRPKIIIHFAAQAGVRYSIQNPDIYLKTNILGTFNIIKIANRINLKHLIIGSSSSVYGANKKFPFREIDKADHQVSFYAATKKSTESLAHSYSSLWKLPITMLRFFTVYGPWGRPDMAMYIFADKIIKGKKIPVFNHGKMRRDFTYVDDIINGVVSSIKNNYECEVFNLGNSHSEDLMDMIGYIEKELGQKAEVDFLGIQPGDVEKTAANIDRAKTKLDYFPKTSIKEGVPKFISWYKSYHRLS